MNVFSKYYLIAFNGIAISGTLAVFVNRIVEYYRSRLLYKLINSDTFDVRVASNLKTHGTCKNPYSYQIGDVNFQLLSFFWIISIVCIYIMVIFSIAIPLSQLFNLFAVIFPSICILVKRNSLGIFTLGVLLMAHVLSANRVYIVSALILFFVSIGTKRKIPIIMPVLCLCVLMVSLSMLKIENDVINSNFNEFMIDITSKLGSEWQDGILLHSQFTDDQITSGRLSYAQSLLTIIPLHGALGIISYEDYYNNLMSTHLLSITGLGAEGYTGIRMGLIWEIYVCSVYLVLSYTPCWLVSC